MATDLPPDFGADGIVVVDELKWHGVRLSVFKASLFNTSLARRNLGMLVR